MTVKELTEILYEFNPNAEVNIISEGRSHNFEITFGSADGVTTATAETVSFHIDEDIVDNETTL